MAEDLTGKQIARYQVLERLGRGGMAEVYRAYQPGLDRYVAIKVIHPHLADDPELIERFSREARAVAALRHPNIVQVYDFDVSGTTPFMAMEFISGPTLKALLNEFARRGMHLPLPVAGLIVAQIADALAYAHNQGIIHRDVKPANVLLRQRSQPAAPLAGEALIDLAGHLCPDDIVLTDFGVARIMTSSAQYTATGIVLGSPAYMSPEQGRGEHVDARSDIYSLGVVFYELLTGRVPFDADTPFAVMLKHISAPLPPPRSFYADLPEEVERIVLRALAKRPEDRFQSAEEFARALRRPSDVLPVAPGAGMSAPATATPASSRETVVLDATGVGPVSSPATPAPPAAPVAPKLRRRTIILGVRIVLVLVAMLLVWIIIGPRRHPSTMSTQHPVVATPLAQGQALCPVLHSSSSDCEQAIAVYSAVLAQSPDNAPLLAARALAYASIDPHNDGYGPQALADAGRALELDPRSAMAYLVRGYVTEIQSENAQGHAAALADYNSALEHDPAYIDARLARARLLEHNAATREQARADLDYLVEHQPELVEARLLRASVNRSVGRIEEALDDYDEALDEDAFNVAVLTARAELYSNELNDFNAALSDYNTAIEADPHNSQLYILRAAVYIKKGDLDLALADAEQLITLAPSEPQHETLRGYVLLALEQLDEAAGAFDRAMLLGGEAYIEPRYGMALIKIKRGDPIGAIPELELVAAQADEFDWIWSNFYAGHRLVYLDLAHAYAVVANRNVDVERALTSAVEADSDWYLPYLQRAHFYRVEGRREEARADLRRALELARVATERDEIEKELSFLR